MISVKNLTNEKVSEVFLKTVAKTVLTGENNIKKDLSIVLVGEEKMKEVNNQYRKINSPTDVLSFEEVDEILICPEVAKKQGTDFKKEVAFILIHGILHLLGYDHENSREETEKMQEKEKYYLSKIYG